MQLGNNLYLQDKPVDAEPWLVTALGIHEKTPDTKPGEHAHILLILGMVKMDRKQFAQAEAEKHAQRSLAIQEKLKKAQQ